MINLKQIIKLLLIKYPFIYNKIQNIRSKRIIHSIIKNEYKFLCQHSGSINTLNKKLCLETQIQLRAHCIEKGLSLRNPKIGFGKKIILELIEYIKQYVLIYGNNNFIIENIKILNAYVSFHNDIDVIDDIVNNLKQLKSITGEISSCDDAGIIYYNYNENMIARKGDFEQFAKSRHSLRYFDNTRIDIMDAVKKSLELAQTAPSACNRQPQKVYVFRNKAKDTILKFQQGANSFSSEVDTVLLITAQQERYCYDIHQPYIDGGIYSMNLLYSLHYYGLGTIPLSAGMITEKEYKQICKMYNISEGENFILFIAVGGMPQECKSNYSYRNPVKDIYKVYDE